MQFSSLYLLLVAFSSAVESQESGKVYIGSAENDTQQLYEFNFNVVKYNASALRIPVYVVPYIVTNVTSVNVTCDLPLGNILGFSFATFGFVSISVQVRFGQIPFSAGSAIIGRESTLQCYAVGRPDYKPSELKRFAITPPGKVNVYYSVNVAGSPFWIKLSEPAVQYAVTVNCTTTGGSTYGTTTIDVGSQFKQITGGSLAVGNGTTVTCSGQSNNGGLQFTWADSVGLPGQVIPFVGSAGLYPAVTQLSGSLKMKAFLVLNTVPSNPTGFDFVCTIHTVRNLSEVENVTTPTVCPLSSSTTESPIVNTTSGQWTLTRGQTCAAYTITTQPFAMLTLERTTGVALYTEEIIYVQCITTDPLFTSVKPNLLVYAYLYPPASINWTLANEFSNQTTKNSFPNPGYVNVAPCPCNLKRNTCDTNCCCDTECTSLDIKTFTCFPGFFGGYGNMTSQEFCNATYFYRPDWFMIMCIVSENNGFLGYFYYPVNFLQSLNGYNSLYSYYEQEVIAPGELNGTKSGYTYGLAVKTGLQLPFGLPKSEFANAFGPNYLLTLPQRSFNGGHCTWSAPVQFLIESSEVCDVTVNDALCTTNFQLSAIMYAQSLKWGTSTGPLVLLKQQEANITSVNINFLCADTISTATYVKSQETYAGKVSSDVTSCFVANDSCVVDGYCVFNETTSAYLCPNNSVSWTSTRLNAPRCPWDDGFTKPPSPALNSTARLCNNVVLSILYNFTWSNQTIVGLNATIIMGNVLLGNDTTGLINVRQEFAVVFVGNTTESPTNTSFVDTNATASDYIYPSSGNPGYDKLLPIISGISVRSLNTTDNFTYVDTNITNRLSIFSPDPSGLCTNAGRKDLLFTADEASSCQLRLNYGSFADCNNLRKLTLNALNQLMPSNYISIVGRPSISNETHWLQILRQDVSAILGDVNTTTDVTTALPSFTTTSSSLLTTELSNSSVTNAPPTSTYTYLEDLTGVCHNITTGIHIDILYAQAGLSNFQPIYMVVGARINYTISSWYLYCVGASSVSCAVNSSFVQSFRVSSSVRFVQVPPTLPSAPTLYEQQTRRPVSVCPQGSCWSEFFYPFMNLNLGRTQQATLAVASFFSGLIVLLAILLTCFCT